MKRFAITLTTLLVSWLIAWQVASHWPEAAAPPRVPGAEAPYIDTLAIAPREEALTFARFQRGNEPQLLLVHSFSAGTVSGVDIGQRLPGSPTDPIALFNHVGFEVLQNLDGAVVSVGLSELIVPFAGTDNQIAVGINYPAHSDETAVTDSFLFPKRTSATSFQASVVAGDHLLDYEIELGFVLLQDLARGTQPAYLGLVLASDYTDRAELMRHANLTDISSGDGFTAGKSFPGFMPLGNLFIIPKDYRHFYPGLKLELWLNGEKRQQASPASMTWDFQRIVAETFDREDRHWQWRGAPVALPVERGQIPARTIFLSGTPGGVIYQKPTLRQIFIGISEMFFTLRWSDLQSVVEPFLREEYRSGRYLTAGDLVQMKAEHLGTISNTIVAK